MQELVAAFVPCADEVHRLQSQRDADCVLFRTFCNGGHYTEPGKTRQGIYVVTPSGLLLASANTTSADRLAELLRDGLAAWDATDADRRHLPDDTRRALQDLWRWDDEYPADGLVLEVVTRDLPRDEAERPGRRRWRWTDGAWNRDWAWFRADEARAMVPPARVGAELAVPRPLVERLVRFHLIDDVRGQTDPYEVAQVEAAELVATVAAVDADGVDLTWRGRTRAVAPDGDDWPRGFETELSGTARWDPGTGRFTAFELVAAGRRWGATRFNARERDPGPAPVGAVLQLAAPDAPRVAPAFVWRYGWRPAHR